MPIYIIELNTSCLVEVNIFQPLKYGNSLIRIYGPNQFVLERFHCISEMRTCLESVLYFELMLIINIIILCCHDTIDQRCSGSSWRHWYSDSQCTQTTPPRQPWQNVSRKKIRSHLWGQQRKPAIVGDRSTGTGGKWSTHQSVWGIDISPTMNLSQWYCPSCNMLCL